MKELFRRKLGAVIHWALYDTAAADRYRSQDTWGRIFNREPLAGWIDQEF